MSYEQLKIETETLQSFIEMPFEEDAQLTIERGNAIAAWLARSSVMLAEAKQILNASKTSEICNLVKTTFADNKLSAQVQNSLLNSICQREQYLVDWLTEANKTLKHQLEWCRSIISKYKSELNLTNIGKEFN